MVVYHPSFIGNIMNDDGTYISAITLDSTFRKQSTNNCNNLIPIRCHDTQNQEKTQSGIVKKKAYLKLAIRIKELQEKVRLAKMIEGICSPSNSEIDKGASSQRLVRGNYARSDALARSRAPSHESFLSDANNSCLSLWSQETSKTFSSSCPDIIVNAPKIQPKSCFPIEDEDSSGRGGQCSVNYTEKKTRKEYHKAFAGNTKNIRRISQSYRPNNHNNRLVTIDDETDEENDELQDAKTKHKQKQSAFIHKRSQYLDRENKQETENDGLSLDHKSYRSHDYGRSFGSNSTNHISRRSVDNGLDRKFDIQGENFCMVDQDDVDNSSSSSCRISRSSASHWSPGRNVDDSMITFHDDVGGDSNDSATCFREVGKKELDLSYNCKFERKSNSSNLRNIDKDSKSIRSNKSASSLPMFEVAEGSFAFKDNKDVFDISVPNFYEKDLDQNSIHSAASKRSVKSGFSHVKSMKPCIALPGKNSKFEIDGDNYDVFEVDLATCYPAGDGNSTCMCGSRRSESSVSNNQTTLNSNRRDLSPTNTAEGERIHSLDAFKDDIFPDHDASSSCVTSSVDSIDEDSIHSKPTEKNPSKMTHHNSQIPDFRCDATNEDHGELEVGFPSYDSEEEAENFDRRQFRLTDRFTRMKKISMIQEVVMDDDDEESDFGFPIDSGELLVGFPSKSYD
jgi:hypothetical protein